METDMQDLLDRLAEIEEKLDELLDLARVQGLGTELYVPGDE